MDSEENMEFIVKPYQFEPVQQISSDEDSSESDSEESDSSDVIDTENPPADLDEWCTCGGCQQMPTQIECCCCKQFQACQDLLESETGSIDCITLHEGFRVNCLNMHVLRLAFYDYLDTAGHIGDEEPIHEIYRYISYRRCARWLWGRLGRKNRRVLPSCVVIKIRETFPSEEYTGFLYPRD